MAGISIGVSLISDLEGVITVRNKAELYTGGTGHWLGSQRRASMARMRLPVESVGICSERLQSLGIM